jgi:hypothetical protein
VQRDDICDFPGCGEETMNKRKTKNVGEGLSEDGCAVFEQDGGLAVGAGCLGNVQMLQMPAHCADTDFERRE